MPCDRMYLTNGGVVTIIYINSHIKSVYNHIKIKLHKLLLIYIYFCFNKPKNKKKKVTWKIGHVSKVIDWNSDPSGHNICSLCKYMGIIELLTEYMLEICNVNKMIGVLFICTWIQFLHCKQIIKIKNL